MASVRDLIVFAYLAGTENRFVPAGRLTLTETPSPNPAARELASAFAYGTRYLERPDSFELDPVSLSHPSSTVRAPKRPFSRSCPRSHAGFKAIFQKVV